MTLTLTDLWCEICKHSLCTTGLWGMVNDAIHPTEQDTLIMTFEGCSSLALPLNVSHEVVIEYSWADL